MTVVIDDIQVALLPFHIKETKLSKNVVIDVHRVAHPFHLTDIAKIIQNHINHSDADSSALTPPPFPHPSPSPPPLELNRVISNRDPERI